MTLSMINTLLATMPFGERMGYGAQVFVVGILTVFSVLIILWMVLLLFRLFAYDIPQKKKKASAAKPVETPVNTAPAAVEAAPEAETDDGEIVAAITAAIEAYRASTGSALPFRVVSFKRVRGANGWNGNDTNETI